MLLIYPEIDNVSVFLLLYFVHLFNSFVNGVINVSFIQNKTMGNTRALEC